MAGMKQLKTDSEGPADSVAVRDNVSRCVNDRLANCSYAFYLNCISWSYDRGELTLNGRVPTFHLKQMLETLLRDIAYVDTVINNVDVVSSTGLSTTQPK